MNLTYTLALLLAVFAAATCQVIGKCGKERSRKFDSCANKLFVIGDKNARFPSNATQADQWCNEAKEAIKCIKDFTKSCLSSLAKQVSNLLAFGANKHVKKVCKNKQSRTEAYKNLQCLNRNYTDLNQVMVNLVDNYQKSIGTAKKERIPALCCKFGQFRTDAHNQASKTCSKEETLYFDAFISSFASDILDLLCGSYQNLEGKEKCANVTIPATKPSPMRRTKSPMPPLLMAMSTI